MSEKGLPLPKATSTGTTIVGCLFKDGIVLGADTRATEGPIVADKNCEKVSSSNRVHPTSHAHTFIDSLHHRVYSMLRSGYSCRHRVHHSSHLI